MGKKEIFLRKIYVKELVELDEFKKYISKAEIERVKSGRSLNNPPRVVKKMSAHYHNVSYDSEKVDSNHKQGYFEIGDLKLEKERNQDYKVRNRKRLDQLATKLFLEYLQSIDHESSDEMDYIKTRKRWLYEADLIKEGFYRLSLPYGSINKNNYDELYRYTVGEDIKGLFKKIETGINPLIFEKVYVAKLSGGVTRKLTQEESFKYEEIQSLSHERLMKKEQDRFVENYMKVFYNFEKVWSAFQLSADEIEKHTESLLESLPNYLGKLTQTDYIRFYKTNRDLRIIKQEFKIPSQQMLLYDIVKNTTYTYGLLRSIQEDFIETKENRIKARRDFFNMVKAKDQEFGYVSSVEATYKQCLDIEVKIIGDTLTNKYGEEYKTNSHQFNIIFNDFAENKIAEQLELLINEC